MGTVASNITRINVKIKEDLTIIEETRSFMRFFNISHHMGDFGVFFFKDYYLEDFKKFLSSVQVGEIKYFTTNLSVRNEETVCLLKVSRHQEYYSVYINVIDTLLDSFDDIKIEKEEFKAVLGSLDTYYLVYSYDSNKFKIKGTKHVGTLSEGLLEELSYNLYDFFGVNGKRGNEEEIERLKKDIQLRIMEQKYVLKKAFGNYISFTTRLITVDGLDYVICTVATGQKKKAAIFYEKNDVMTNLYNKKAITEIAITRIEKSRIPCALFIVDVDNFKEYNDKYGHLYGDEVIKKMGIIIKEAVGNSGVAGRIGGDEFLCIIDAVDEEDIRNVARNIKYGLQWHFPASKPSDVVTCSIGISRFPKNGLKYDKLFDIADKCLYIAKRKGKNCYVIYKPEMHDKVFKNYDFTAVKVKEGVEYISRAEKQTAILDILYEKKEGYAEKVLSLLKDYMEVSKICLYDQNLKVVKIVGVNEKNDREGMFGRDYFAHFNSQNYMILDNVNVFESLDKDRFKMYSNHEIATTLEIAIKDGEELKGLLCCDLYKPARTLAQHQVTFALLVAKKLIK